MAKQRKSQALTDAKKFYKLLLYEASGGNLGTAPEHKVENQSSSFAEKKGLLSEIIKLAMIEQKGLEDQEEITGLDLIKRNLDGNRTDRSARDIRGTESGSDDEYGETTDEA